jgi:hypothetical protein
VMSVDLHAITSAPIKRLEKTLGTKGIKKPEHGQGVQASLSDRVCRRWCQVFSFNTS